MNRYPVNEDDAWVYIQVWTERVNAELKEFAKPYPQLAHIGMKCWKAGSETIQLNPDHQSLVPTPSYSVRFRVRIRGYQNPQGSTYRLKAVFPRDEDPKRVEYLLKLFEDIPIRAFKRGFVSDADGKTIKWKEDAWEKMSETIQAL